MELITLFAVAMLLVFASMFIWGLAGVSVAGWRTSLAEVLVYTVATSVGLGGMWVFWKLFEWATL